MLKVGRVSYINMLPLFYPFASGRVDCDAEFMEGVPTDCNRKLLAGELDMSFMSAAEYLKHKEELDLLLPFGVAARQQAMSVTLYVRGDVADLEGATVGLTQESATSIALARMLCLRYWNVSPHFVPIHSAEEATKHQGFVLIGNQALLHSEFEGYRSIDLATAWHHQTGLPIVFAVLAVRRAVLQERSLSVTAFHRALTQALRWSEEHPDEIVEAAQEQLPLPYEKLQRYFQSIHYRLDDQDMSGLRHYAHLLEEGAMAGIGR